MTSKMKHVLILTYEKDPHSEFVCKYFNKTGIDYFEVLTDKLIGNYDLSFDLSKNIFTISNSERKIELNKEWSIWNRRVMDPTIPKTIHKKLKEIIYTETKRTWDAILFSHSGKVINKPQSNFNANNKINQLKYAKNYGKGIKIPETILTNDPKKLIEFYREMPKISFKLLKAPIIETNKKGEYLTCYNNLVSEENIKNSGLIKNNPSLFQRYINKDYEIRITALEKEVIGIKINSQASELSKVDFRRYDFKNVSYEKVDLPKNVETFCKNLIKHYNLSFGELDFIKDKKGDYYFLELNPNGQWLWLELKSNYNLTKHVAENLL